MGCIRFLVSLNIGLMIYFTYSCKRSTLWETFGVAEQ